MMESIIVSVLPSDMFSCLGGLGFSKHTVSRVSLSQYVHRSIKEAMQRIYSF